VVDPPGAELGPPPRARGRQPRPRAARTGRGTTPASAGTTRSPGIGCTPPTDHPRERGDDVRFYRSGGNTNGPPPRARGRLRARRPAARCRGTTPASAGTTPSRSRRSARPGDHPRERGDDLRAASRGGHRLGPPPRARGRHGVSDVPARGVRTTPASAGTTRCRAAPAAGTGDHPRERGDDVMADYPTILTVGPPPRARGRHLPTCDNVAAEHAVGATCYRPRKRRRRLALLQPSVRSCEPPGTSCASGRSIRVSPSISTGVHL
jgi:hypothetical protein